MVFPELPIDRLAGLPLHPLIVHAVVVLVPLTALGLVVMVSSVPRSRRFGPAVVFVAAAAAVSAFLAAASGQQFRDALGLRGGATHFNYGQWLPWLALLLLIAVVAVFVRDLRGGTRRGTWGTTLAVVAVLIAIAATGLVVATGHSGAGLVWG